MRTIFETIRRVFSSPLAQIALLVTILVGILSIIEKAVSLIMGAYQHLCAIAHLRIDRRIFKYMKMTKPPGGLYEVKDIAQAVKKKPAQVMEALKRLQARQKIHCYQPDKGSGGLWEVHEFET